MGLCSGFVIAFVDGLLCSRYSIVIGQIFGIFLLLQDYLKRLRDPLLLHQEQSSGRGWLWPIPMVFSDYVLASDVLQIIYMIRIVALFVWDAREEISKHGFKRGLSMGSGNCIVLKAPYKRV